MRRAFKVSLKTRAPKIKQHPTIIRGVNNSCNKMALKITPNTDSKDNRIEAIDEGTYLSPIFCKEKPTIVLNRPK